MFHHLPPSSADVSVENVIFYGSLYRGVESFTIFTINFSIHGSIKRFFDKLKEGSRAESSIYVVKIT